MDQRAFASATQLAGEIRDRRIGCVDGAGHTQDVVAIDVGPGVDRVALFDTLE